MLRRYGNRQQMVIPLNITMAVSFPYIPFIDFFFSAKNYDFLLLSHTTYNFIGKHVTDNTWTFLVSVIYKNWIGFSNKIINFWFSLLFDDDCFELKLFLYHLLCSYIIVYCNIRTLYFIRQVNILMPFNHHQSFNISTAHPFFDKWDQ